MRIRNSSQHYTAGYPCERCMNGLRTGLGTAVLAVIVCTGLTNAKMDWKRKRLTKQPEKKPIDEDQDVIS